MPPTHVLYPIGLIVRPNSRKMLSPELKITIRAYLCSRCGHLWERRVKGTKGLPVTCPSCNPPYWNSKPKKEKELLPLTFHGEEILDSNFEEVITSAREDHRKPRSKKKEVLK